MNFRTILMAAMLLTLAVMGWFLFDTGRDLAAAEALASERKSALENAEASRRSLEQSIVNLSQSDTNTSSILRLADSDIEALRQIPSDGRCGAPVHAAVDMLRNDAAGN